MRSCSVAPIAGVSVAVAPWRREGQLAATVIVKATFSFADGGALRQVEPIPIRRAEVHHRNNPSRSVREPDDLAPHKRKADVLFAGSARAAKPVTELDVRLALLRGGAPLLDKSLLVVGDRDEEGAAPRPFSDLPLVYERAKGGFGVPENPLGCALPNVLPPRSGKVARPAGLGPISWTWPARRAALKGASRKLLEQEIAEVGGDLDEYFQSAPVDQRTAAPAPGDRLVLAGLVEGHPELTLALPSARGVAVVRLPGEPIAGIELEADTLLIDGDAQTLSLVWRGARGVPSESALFGAVFAGALEVSGAPLRWPELVARAAPAASPSQPVGLGGTVIMAEPGGATQPGAASAASQTVVIEEPAPLVGTVVIEEPADPRSLPFKGAAPSPVREHEPRSIPGAPWGSSPSPEVPTHAFAGTVELSLEGAKLPAPPPPAPPPPAPPPPPPPVVKSTAAKWRKDEPQREPAPTPAPAPQNAAAARAPSPAVKKSLYGKFGK